MIGDRKGIHALFDSEINQIFIRLIHRAASTRYGRADAQTTCDYLGAGCPTDLRRTGIHQRWLVYIET
jgi:hypothetical protein